MNSTQNNPKKISFSLALAAIAFAFFALVLLNNLVFNKARIDLTEGNIYSISDGTHQVLEQIDEPINLYFFFSNKATEGLTSLRNYASRVQSLLEEYELYSDGKVKLHIIDPEPFSEAEDKAAEMGLTAAPISAIGESVYLGLAATNSLDDTEIIAFFDPSQERQLEYEISKLIHRLSNPEPVKVSVLTSLAIEGGMNPNPMAMQMGQPQQTPAWASFMQLQQLYDVEVLANDAETIPSDTKVLVLIHPKELTDAQLFAIDQYVLAGGKALVFVDPAAESDSQAPGMMGMPSPSSSDLNQLFTAWGVEYDASQILLDAAKGLEIRMPNGMPGRHIGYIGLTQENVNSDDIVTASLSSINGASMGSIAHSENATTNFEPIFSSSEYANFTSSQTYMMAARNPDMLSDGFNPLGEPQVIAARISGTVKSAFDQLPEGIELDEDTEWLKETNDLQVMLVADTDVLTDSFWVQVSNFFGQQVLQPFANNGDFLINAVDNLGGSSALMSIRGRGQYQRPFDVVEQLTVEAEAKFREQEQRLQAQLQETENQLSQLQSSQQDGGQLVLTPEQEAAVDEFVAKKLAIRKELREVRHQLDKDIETLGTWLKVLNIAIFPLLLTFALAFVARQVRKNMMAQMQR
ncbi:MAG: Gldg family protein [Gammaproteobacteria bacterium]|nr:Gldg family protein [Gammaproteobacteria bacterium]